MRSRSEVPPNTEETKMPIKTSTSMEGFIASAPQLSRTENGDARLYVKVGQEHFVRNEDGSFTQTETNFHDLVMFRRAAERAAARFTIGGTPRSGT